MLRSGANDIEDFIAEVYRRSIDRIAGINLVRPMTPNTKRLPGPLEMGSGSRSVCSESVRKGVLTMSTESPPDWAVHRPY